MDWCPEHGYYTDDCAGCLKARAAELEWLIRELHEGACSPAYRPPDSDYRLWALELIEQHGLKGTDLEDR